MLPTFQARSILVYLEIGNREIERFRIFILISQKGGQSSKNMTYTEINWNNLDSVLGENTLIKA